MDIFERKETPEWRKLCAMLERGSNGILTPDILIEAYMFGQTDADMPEFVMTDEKHEASMKVAQTLVAFREHLIANGFQSNLADIITREHHMALFTKDFIKLSKEKND